MYLKRKRPGLSDLAGDVQGRMPELACAEREIKACIGDDDLNPRRNKALFAEGRALKYRASRDLAAAGQALKASQKKRAKSAGGKRSRSSGSSSNSGSSSDSGSCSSE